METSSQNLFYLCAAQVHWNIDMLDFFINAAHPSVGYGNMPDALMCMLVSSTDGVGTATQSIMRMVVRPLMMRSVAIRPDLTEQGERFNYLT